MGMSTSRYAIILSTVSLAAALGCQPGGGNAPRTEEVAEVRPARPDMKSVPALSTAERMGVNTTPTGAKAVGTGGAAAGGEVVWDTPEGWEPLPATQFRQANFTVAGNPKAEAYLTVLPGDGGGLLPNINRWRAQIGAEPLDQAALDALPQIPMLGTQAHVVTAEGTFTGMGGAQNEPGFALRAVAAISGGKAYFVKMTGPAEIVAAEAERFDQFVSSLREEAGASPEAAASNLPPDHPPLETGGGDAAGLPPAHPPIGGPAPMDLPNSAAETFDPASLHWEPPAGWTQSGDRPMRLVTYTFGPENQGEIYITVLSGDGGGMSANLNRWQQQMGQPALTPEQLEALPKVEVLGEPVPMMDATGDFTGMSGATQSNYRTLGVVRLLEDHALFIKMVGPADVVADQVENFKAFSASLHRSE